MAHDWDISTAYTTITTVNIDKIFITPTSSTTADVKISKSAMEQEPTKYQIIYTLVDDNNNELGSPQSIEYTVQDQAETVYGITGLTANSRYSVSVTAYIGTGIGNTITDYVYMSNVTFNGKVVGGGIDAGKISSSKAYLTITGPEQNNKFAVATRTFNAITIPTITTTSASSMLSEIWTVQENINNYSTKYFSFGTSLFMDSTIKTTKQGAGIGFFTNTEGTAGYFLIIETTALSASKDKKSIRFIKTDGTRVYPLKDSQQSISSTFEGVYGGVQYNIDLKVKVSGARMDMVAYINGYKITASDEFSYSDTGANYIVSPTKNVSLICSNGTVAFDYAYGTDITQSDYDSNSYQMNFYQGQFSNDLLNTTYGDVVYSGNYGEDVYTKKQSMVDEFGTTVREITKANIKFPSRPAFPIKWSTGNNRLVSILGSKISNFNGEAYVLNNTSTTIPLSDNNMASFYIFGNTLSPSGQLEYSTDESNTYTTIEPVTFQSKWLQTLSDVKSLAEWIKTNVVNKGKTVTMTVFGNPLISVGNMISINYPYQGFTGTEKFIVTSVNHTYNNGLETSITCRFISA